MNVKLIFILTVSAIILFGVVGLGVKFFTQFGGVEEPIDEGYEFPTDSGPEIPEGYMIVPTSAGGAATVKDLRQSRGVEDIGDSNYIIAGESVTTSAYELVFSESDRSYLISLNSLPLAEARLQGERDLLKRLGVTEEVACTLRIRVATQFDVSETYAGKELGLSFCSGSLMLE